MIKLSGTLFIRQVNGRNGAFSVGRLVTPIGEFAIKDTLLDQYDEGRYEGEFGISRIYHGHYVAGGRMVIEVRATLETLALAAIGALPIAQSGDLQEPDPLDQESSRQAEVSASVDSWMQVDPLPESSESASAVAADGDFIQDDADLFGALWPLEDTVKLDTTVDRVLFRRQKERLKVLNYRFQPVGQTWQRD
ncbi:DUF3275 family protein [Methyloterricola oryzae]|uniref:DUF3275 family protein n=1 Tax=Methyloterricola oryzae TaxID=1495050 RepID=UPI0005EBCBBF|nr:DUF3275 family protein [Methyloterricola oryzae]